MSEANSNDAERPKALIVEDDGAVITLLEELFRQEGFEPVVAEDGLEGLVKIRTGNPDIAILDIMMPDVNGVRLLEQLLEEGDGSLPVPIVVITGSPEGAARSRELLGEENVFEKPFDPELLVRQMWKSLRERDTGGRPGEDS